MIQHNSNAVTIVTAGMGFPVADDPHTLIFKNFIAHMLNKYLLADVAQC